MFPPLPTSMRLKKSHPLKLIARGSSWGGQQARSPLLSDSAPPLLLLLLLLLRSFPENSLGSLYKFPGAYQPLSKAMRGAKGDGDPGGLVYVNTGSMNPPAESLSSSSRLT